VWSIAYGREEEHAEQLKRGMAKMIPGFAADICWGCKGEGRRKQTFTNGCGMGYSTSMAGCDICDGTGLLQGQKAAPASVRAQVLNAAI
jgi:hypothetical protein